jgi:tetratricopeptide (TPR) repeat protein
MRFLLRRIRGILRDFIGGTTHTVLVLACEPEQSAVPLKCLDGLEQDPTEPAIFLTFGEPFAGLAAFAAQVTASVRQQSEEVSSALAKQKQPPLTPFPEELRESSVPPKERIAGAFRYARKLVPEDTPIVWIVYPLEVSKPDEYLALVRFLRGLLDDPALPRTRLILRDGVARPMLAPHFQEDVKVHVYQPRLGPAAMEQQLTAEANNPFLPAEERAGNHLLLAGIDVAHKRYDQAMARNLELAGYFEGKGQRTQQSMVLNNIGDLHYTQQRFPQAQEWYERAITLAVALKAQMLVLYQSINLGNALLAQGKNEEALGYYEAAAKLGEVSRAPLYQIQALEQLGVVQRRLRRNDEAAAAWEKTAELGGRIRYETARRSALGRLRQLYGEMGKKDRLAACERALAETGRN